MKCFTVKEFEVYPNTSVHPQPARQWRTLKEVQESYKEFCVECDKWGQEPLDLWIYAGTLFGDEATYGYPDYPDYILSHGPRGGIHISRA